MEYDFCNNVKVAEINYFCNLGVSGELMEISIVGRITGGKLYLLN